MFRADFVLWTTPLHSFPEFIQLRSGNDNL